jgi:hypothetical protein
MGNIPAKITGKYQSYDINTPFQATPAPTLRRGSNMSSKLERNEYIDFLGKDHQVDPVEEYIRNAKDMKIYQFSGIMDQSHIVEQNDKVIELDGESNRKWFNMEDEDDDGADDLDDLNHLDDHASNAVNQLTQSKLNALVNEFNFNSKLNDMPVDVTNESIRSILIENSNGKVKYFHLSFSLFRLNLFILILRLFRRAYTSYGKGAEQKN